MSLSHPKHVLWLDDPAAQKCAVSDTEVLPELAEGAYSASMSNKSGGYTQVTVLARLQGMEAVPLELLELWLEELTGQEK